MTERLTQPFGSPVAAHQAALRELWAMTYAQAETLSYADAFRAIMLAFIIGTCLVPFLKKVAPPSSPPADAH